MNLYDEWVRDHSRSPRFQPPLSEFTHRARCDNPLCGDRVDITVQVEDGRIAAVGLKARACAITKASASLMSTLIAEQPVEAMVDLAARAQAVADAKAPSLSEDDPLTPLAIVRTAPSRRRCATLPWEALLDALKDD